MTLTYILTFTLAASLGSVAVASVFLVVPDRTRSILVPCFISYATGSLLGAAFLGLTPPGVGTHTRRSGRDLDTRWHSSLLHA